MRQGVKLFATRARPRRTTQVIDSQSCGSDAVLEPENSGMTTYHAHSMLVIAQKCRASCWAVKSNQLMRSPNFFGELPPLRYEMLEPPRSEIPNPRPEAPITQQPGRRTCFTSNLKDCSPCKTHASIACVQVAKSSICAPPIILKHRKTLAATFGVSFGNRPLNGHKNRSFP